MTLIETPLANHPSETVLDRLLEAADRLAAAEYELDEAREMLGRTSLEARESGMSIPKIAAEVGLSAPVIHKYSSRFLPEGAPPPKAKSGRPAKPKPPKKPRQVDNSPAAQARRAKREEIRLKVQAKRQVEAEADQVERSEADRFAGALSLVPAG